MFMLNFLFFQCQWFSTTLEITTIFMNIMRTVRIFMTITFFDNFYFKPTIFTYIYLPFFHSFTTCHFYSSLNFSSDILEVFTIPPYGLNISQLRKKVKNFFKIFEKREIVI